MDARDTDNAARYVIVASDRISTDKAARGKLVL